MTSPLQQAVASIQLCDNASCVMITAIVYDYILTFSEEVEYVWSKHWTWVSTLFVLARYFGICSVMLHAIWWNSAVKLSTEGQFRGNVLFIVGGWCFWIFLCSADMVMILRLWALYAQSRFILGTLLIFYAIEVIGFLIVYLSLDSQFPGDPPMSATQVLGYSICGWDKIFPVWDDLQTVTQLTLGAWMCLLIVFQLIKGLVEMYKATNQSPLGHYQKLLLWEGLAYFIIVLAFAIIYQLGDAGLIPENGWAVLSIAIQQTLPFTVFPRFVLSLRALYARGAGGRGGEGIDTAFGFASPESPHLATMSGITFADSISQNGNRSDDMEMDMIKVAGNYGARASLSA